MKITTLKKGEVNKFLKRLKSPDTEISGPELDGVLKEILSKANAFVPSKAGAILLDDPHCKSEAPDCPSESVLHFVACFGPGSTKLLGQKISATTGVAGSTYIKGKPFMGNSPKNKPKSFIELDNSPGRKAKCVLCVPIVIGESVCGVIELLDQKERGSYTKAELNLIEIFAGYTSTLIQNALDAKRNQELTRLDNLTGLYNDRYFHSQLSEDIKKAKRTKKDISLLFIDLDNFKTINDTHGHLVGSRTLTEVGHLIRDTLADENVRIIRYGGDEFTVILPGKNKGEAARVAEMVRAAVEKAVFLKGRPQAGQHAHNLKGIITCSIGISSFFEDLPEGRTLEQEKIAFIRSADQAMYAAKVNGKNRLWLA